MWPARRTCKLTLDFLKFGIKSEKNPKFNLKETLNLQQLFWGLILRLRAKPITAAKDYFFNLAYLD